MRGAILTRCNCTLCHKSGSLLADPGPDPSFELLSPAEGESALTDYTFNKNSVHFFFCPKCGIKCFLKGSYIHEGKEILVMRVNALTLDGKVDGTPMDDLRDIKIKYWDGKSDDWSKDPADKPWNGGSW